MLVLESLSRSPLHGYAIAKAIKAKSEGVLDFREGTLYPTLHSMENEGLLEGYSQTEAGRERKYYQLTEDGRNALVKARGEWKQFRGAVDKVIGGLV